MSYIPIFDGHMKLFNKSFFKFVFGFLAIVSVTLIMIVVVGSLFL